VPCCAEVMEYLGERWFRLKDPVTALFGLISQCFARKFRYDRIIAISEFTKHELEQAGFASRDITVVPCGVDVEQFGDASFLERTPNSLIVVGRLVPQKGHRYLFNALKYVREHIPDIHLRVVGDGPMRIELESLAYREGLGNNISFIGRVTEEEKIALLRRSSIFVMPSLQEGFGIVLLEAMACGLPIVAFDLPVYQEFMDSDCGSLVPKMDSQAMATQIIRLLRDSGTRDRIGIHNLTYVRQFGWDRIAELEERVLQDVVIGSKT
jgi:glycosyltransferase involved in cell wall biosynthesis